MSQCKIFLTSNAGVAVVMPHFKLWSDAAHCEKVLGFSTVNTKLWSSLLDTADVVRPNLIIYSHKHPDHYSQTLTAQALSLWPEVRLAAPFYAFAEQTLLSAPRETFTQDGAVFHFAALNHEPGPGIAPLPHYGCLAEVEGMRLLLTGDCALEEPALAELTDGKPVDVAVMNFPWLALRRGREFIRNYIRPRHLVICHLPFAEDDVNHYRPAAIRAAARQTDFPDVRLLLEPLQMETFDL